MGQSMQQVLSAGLKLGQLVADLTTALSLGVYLIGKDT